MSSQNSTISRIITLTDVRLTSGLEFMIIITIMTPYFLDTHLFRATIFDSDVKNFELKYPEISSSYDTMCMLSI